MREVSIIFRVEHDSRGDCTSCMIFRRTFSAENTMNTFYSGKCGEQENRDTSD